MPISRSQKEAVLQQIKEDLKRYPVIAIASLQNLPSRQFNLIKKKLRGHADMIVARSTLFKKAIAEARPELAPLAERFNGSAALIATELDPFMLYKIIKQNKSKAAAKPGSIAPFDIVVPAGETNLAPGPVLTELKQAKIDAKIQGPKIVISKDATVAKKGDVISPVVAGVLGKLGVEPMEIGLQLSGVYSAGMIYESAVLDVDEKAYLERLQSAVRMALNLGVYAEIFTAQTAPLLLAKAVREALAIQGKTKTAGTPAASETQTPAAETPATPAPDTPPAA